MDQRDFLRLGWWKVDFEENPISFSLIVCD